MARTARVLDLPFRLPAGEAPLRHRISEAILEEIGAGRLLPGDALPSTRILASQLAVGRGAVVAAYDELTAAGFVDAVAGSGTIVAADACLAARAGARTHVPDGSARFSRAPAPVGTPSVRRGLCSDDLPPLPPTVAGQPSLELRPGAPDTRLINEADWRRAWRVGASGEVDEFVRVSGSHGELQQALSWHLRRTRAVAADPDRILVVPGVNALLPALAAAAGWRGAQVAVEDPGYVDPRQALEREGARVRAVPVDDDGLDPTLLTARDAGVYVTPAHQFPLGGRLPVNRRVELVEWARHHGAFVVEDDYDGEFRYDTSPLPALHSLDGADDHVVYVGTASKILAPSLRVAWVVPPARLLDPLRRELETRGLHVSPVVGRMLAEFIGSGALARHLARAGRTYAARRAALVGALEQQAPWLPKVGVCAGLHVVARLPDDVDDHEVASRLEAKGIRVTPLTAFAMHSTMTGLVIGYATLPETQADRVGREIAAV
ncbi:MAG: PLP-dependent aminotransferase family protein [Intrasporangium sp.]|uniref:MocR-like pyridoxine biosynthesis transcription factor PdxR n=1 Tax=Intrasporangium sp. TaxID=1925024 RepID=UPI002647A418|nr:PLP-dependent aminotransferase family protein [Intrasporangium sp.]MDN5796237.1 PLP-dependent aminotransferase family protein [Intrasporangium sp.]